MIFFSLVLIVSLSAFVQALSINFVPPTPEKYAKGLETVNVSVSNNASVPEVIFSVDGTKLGDSCLAAICEFAWDTVNGPYPDGTHVLNVTARDVNEEVSTVRNVTVANAVPFVLEQAALDFGEAIPGATAAKVLTLNNPNNTAAINISFGPLLLMHEDGNQSKNASFPILQLSDITLNPDEEKNVSVSLPITATQFFGIYSGILSVKSGNYTQNVSVSISVKKVSNLGATFPPLALATGVTKEFPLTITNAGNSDAQVNLSKLEIKKGSTALAASINETAFLLPYNTSKEVTLTLNATASQETGTYNGTLNITLDGNTSGNKTLSFPFPVTVTSATDKIEANPTTLAFSTAERNKTLSLDIDISNTGDFTENVSIAFEGVDSKYNAKFLDGATSVSAFTPVSESAKKFKVSIFVAKDEPSGKKDIGSLKITFVRKDGGGAAQAITVPLTLDVSSMLEIDKIVARVNEKEETLSSGEKFSDPLLPGQKITFEVVVENKLVGVDMEDVEVEATFKDVDGGDDLEVTDEVDIDAGDKESVLVSFVIPLAAEEDTYAVEFVATGDDGKGGTHSDRMNVSVRVVLLEDDIRIIDALLAHKEVSCQRRTVLAVAAANFGSDDQNDARLVVRNSALGLFVERDGLQLDADKESHFNTHKENVVVDVADDAPVGGYTLLAELFDDENAKKDTREVIITVAECTEEEGGGIGGIFPAIAQKLKEGRLISTIEESVGGKGLAAVLGVFLLVLVVLIGVLAWKMSKRAKE